MFGSQSLKFWRTDPADAWPVCIYGVLSRGAYTVEMQEFYQSLWREAEEVVARRKLLVKACSAERGKKVSDKARSIHSDLQ